MFCDNASYDTQKIAKNCANYCSGQEGRLTSYNNLNTQQSQRNPSNYYQTLTNRQQRLKTQQNLQQINQMQALEMIHQNTKRQNEHLKAITRNKKIAAILSTIIAFSQRIEGIKEKLAGYPGQNFSPVQFFNVLDLTQKGYVDLYDVKRFVNNQRISQKDILALFKKVNGDHAKDSSKLSYFGYLNLIKPYFNEQLAKDLLLRDSDKVKKQRKSQRSSDRVDYEIIQPTQQSVLLLFQQLMLLQCICTSEHQQAKEDLMNEYMLNVIEIKQIIGLNHLQNLHQNISALSKASGNQHKTPLKVLYEFIENNSQFQIEFKEIKFLLSFLNAHQFSLTNQKYISLLFIPMNCKNQLLKHFQQQNAQNYNPRPAQNYMNTYLTKQNLINKGNIQPIREYLQNGTQPMNLAQNHMSLTSNSNKMNFLQFVHPKSLQRMSANNLPYPINSFPSEQYMDNPSYNPQKYNQLLNQHPQMDINPSNKFLSQNQSRKLTNPIPSQRQYSNSSSIPQQNIKINPPKQAVQKQQYPSYQALNNQFYNQGQKQPEQMNISGVSQTPFLEKFMKNNNDVKNTQVTGKNQRNPILNQDYSKISQSKFSDSAFEVIDYGYEASNQKTRFDKSNKNKQQLKYTDQSQRFKKQSLDSRYNLVISQYKNSQLHPQDQKRQIQNQPYQQSSHSKNYGPKFEKSIKNNNINVLDYSKGNYIDSVGLSQSNMVNQSNFMNKFYSNGGNILNEFLKK